MAARPMSIARSCVAELTICTPMLSTRSVCTLACRNENLRNSNLIRLYCMQYEARRMPLGDGLPVTERKGQAGLARAAPRRGLRRALVHPCRRVGRDRIARHVRGHGRQACSGAPRVPGRARPGPWPELDNLCRSAQRREVAGVELPLVDLLDASTADRDRHFHRDVLDAVLALEHDGGGPIRSRGRTGNPRRDTRWFCCS